MAQENVRHARSSWEWDTIPSRNDLNRAAIEADQDDPPARVRSRKDRARWCGGHTGREHVPTVVESGAPRCEGPCGWRGVWDREAQAYGPGWVCVHEEICDRCKRRFRHYWEMPARLCPDWPGTQAQHAAAVVKATRMQEAREARIAKWGARLRKPVITGPQGYRRKRPQ